MTREEAIEHLMGNCKVVTHYSWSTDREVTAVPHYGLSDSLALKLVKRIYSDIEDYLKTQMNDQRRDFRNRCVLQEVYESKWILKQGGTR